MARGQDPGGYTPRGNVRGTGNSFHLGLKGRASGDEDGKCENADAGEGSRGVG